MEDAAKSQRAIFFLWKEGTKTSEIVQRLHAVFGENAESKSTVYLWVKKFEAGKSDLEDKHRSGRPVTQSKDEVIAAVEAEVMKDRNVTIREIAEALEMSTGQAHSILTKQLGLAEVTARWVPHALGPELKMRKVQVFCELLGLQEEIGETF